jgi:predicted RNA-binding Zn-ribbon protein involved in translation (DUF1610 family)
MRKAHCRKQAKGVSFYRPPVRFDPIRDGGKMLFCTECGFLGNPPSGRVTDQFKYCPQCGKPSLINSCPACRSSICYEGQKYCMSCGSELVQKEAGHQHS